MAFKIPEELHRMDSQKAKSFLSDNSNKSFTKQ